MKKVFVVNTPLFREKNPLYDEDSLPPIGLGYIATILKQKGLNVELLDAVSENIPLDDLLKIIDIQRPDVIALNIFTTNYELVKDLIESIQIKSIHFIIGGLSTKTLYSDICNWEVESEIDIVFGDGENIIYDLITNEVKETPIYQIKNRRVFKVDSNSIYFSKDISYIPLDRSFFKNEPIQHLFGFTEANIITSRGCIYNCAFCAAARSLNKDYSIREKNVKSIVDEIKHIASIYPNLDSIRVLDDLFLKTKDSIDKAIDVFSQFNLQWRSMAHVMTFKGVSENKIKELKDSGCNELFIGIESGSPEVLRKIHKTHDIGLIKENLSKVLENGINIKGYFIYGFPDETEADFKMTYDLASSLKQMSLIYKSRFRTSVFQFRPYHGTELYHDLELRNEAQNFSKVISVEPNKDLSKLVGRLQFNFHSGNFSNEDIETVHKYIYLTTDLNSTELFIPKS